MKEFRLENFTRGWMVGDFEPTVMKLKSFEFGVKKYQKGDVDQRHMHKQAEEITVIISGLFKIEGRIIKEGDIILIEKNEAVDFECLETGYTAVIKAPSVKDDKYLC